MIYSRLQSKERMNYEFLWVEANYKRRGHYFSGRVVGENGEDFVNIAYDDGDREVSVHKKYIRVLKTQSMEEIIEERLRLYGRVSDNFKYRKGN